LLITWSEATQFANAYPTAADRARLVATMGTDVGFQAIFGPGRQIDTVAGYVSAHLVGVVSIIGAVWGLLTGTRLLRGEEESGRWEMLLAGHTTRRNATAGALGGLGLALATMWAVTATAYLLVGRFTDARFTITAGLFAALASVAAAGMFLAVGALCSQLAVTRRQAVTLAAGVFSAAYLLRAIAYSTTLDWLRWASPLVWVDETHPFIGSHLGPLLLVGAFVAVVAAATIVLAGRRDLGAGVLASSGAAKPHTRFLNGPLGLSARLARGTVLGWMAALAVGGFLFGLAAKGSADVWKDQSGGLFVNLTGARGGATYLGIVFLFVAFLITMAAAGLASAARDEEADGYLDHLLARTVARLRWFTGRYAVAVAALILFGITAGAATWIGTAITGAGLPATTLLAAGVNVVPVAILVLGLAALVHGWAPRLTTIAGYGLVAWSFLIEIIGAGLGAGRWLLDTSLLHHIARAPAVDVRWDAAVILTGLGLIAAVVGAVGFTRRDLQNA
jgi:ABC-2 type transport system permease protein